MSTTRTRLGALVTAGVLTFGLAACGGDDEPEATPVSTTDEAGDAAVTATDEDTEDSTEDETTEDETAESGTEDETAEDPEELSEEELIAAELAQQIGLRIYTIGIGAEQMVIPSITGSLRRVNPSADLDEETLTQIARLTGGRYFRAIDTASLQQIYRLLDEMEPVAEPEGGFRPVRVLYYWPLAGAFVLAFLLAAASLLSNLAVPRLYPLEDKAKVHAD